MLNPFGRWAPGLADTTPGRSNVIDGVVPLADGAYGPMAQFTTVSGASALAEAPRGHISFPKSDGTYVRVLATSSNWYTQSESGALTSIVSGRAVTGGDNESFCRFGNKLLGTNKSDGFNAYDFEAGSNDGAIADAPAARSVFECGNTVVALDCDGNNRLIQNSAFNDHTNWTDAGADYQPLEGGGALIGGVAVTQGSAFIFQKEAIRFMQFGGGGGGALYSLTLVSDQAGATNEASIVAANSGAFFMDTDGPKFVRPGILPVAIGAQDGIDTWLRDNVSAANLERVEGAFDRFRRIVWWRVPVSGDSTTVYSKIIGYHIDYDKWVRLSVSTSALFSTETPGFVWADLTGTWGSYTQYVWGDRYWQGGAPLFGGLDGDFKLAFFSGTPMAATLETALHQFPKSQYINVLTPITDAGSGTMQVGVADRVGDSLTWSGTSSINGEGDCMFLERGKVAKARLNLVAGTPWTYANGVDHANASGR